MAVAVGAARDSAFGDYSTTETDLRTNGVLLHKWHEDLKVITRLQQAKVREIQWLDDTQECAKNHSTLMKRKFMAMDTFLDCGLIAGLT